MSPQFGHGWVGAGCAVHLGLAPNLKYLELVISVAEIEAEMTAGRDAEFECEVSVGEEKFSSVKFSSASLFSVLFHPEEGPPTFVRKPGPTDLSDGVITS